MNNQETQPPVKPNPGDPHQFTPTGKPRARSVGLKYRGTRPPQRHHDAPGVEVGYATLIERDNVRSGVTAIHSPAKPTPATRWRSATGLSASAPAFRPVVKAGAGGRPGPGVP